jgi:hypothetical protein
MPRPKPTIPPSPPAYDGDGFLPAQSGEFQHPDFDLSRPTDVEELRPSGAPPIDVSDTQPPSRWSSRAPGIVQRQDGRLRRRLTIYLSPELAKRLAVHCASNDLEMSEVVEEALAKHLGS